MKMSRTYLNNILNNIITWAGVALILTIFVVTEVFNTATGGRYDE